MAYINTNEPSVPFSYAELIALHPNTSFPPDEVETPPEPYAYVHPTPKPVYNEITDSLIELAPVLVEGLWEQQWAIVSKFSTEEERSIALNLALVNDIKANRELLKQVRAQRVNDIKVTTSNGNILDGDEVSQGRMARAIIALEGSNTAVPWVDANNMTVLLNSTELKEALLLAGTAQSAIWVI
jgi:hypothetical protein